MSSRVKRDVPLAWRRWFEHTKRSGLAQQDPASSVYVHDANAHLNPVSNTSHAEFAEAVEQIPDCRQMFDL